MVLDLGLPDAGGLDVLREIREADGAAARFDPALPVIVAQRPRRARRPVRGLDERRRRLPGQAVPLPGAARRGSARSCAAAARATRARAGSASWSSTRRGARSGSASAQVPLSNKEFTLLRRARRASRPGSSPRRSCCATSGAFARWAATRTLDSHASRLRRKLDPEHGRFVVNCWGVGYRLIED